MRTRTFSEEEKEAIKLQMMEAGIPLLKEQGMIHMSITKLTKAVGIGKSTFYSFYPSKEEFVMDMLNFHRKLILDKISAGLNGKQKYSKDESIEIIRSMITNANNVYQNFTQEDEYELQKIYEKNGKPYLDLEHETKVIRLLCSMMDGVKENLDFAVISNLMKIIVFTSEQKTMLHESGYDRTSKLLVDLLIQSIFD